jgi:hypothetical protein
VQLFFSARDMFELFRAVVPAYHAHALDADKYGIRIERSARAIVNPRVGAAVCCSRREYFPVVHSLTARPLGKRLSCLLTSLVLFRAVLWGKSQEFANQLVLSRAVLLGKD